jgi:UDP-N-acetylmuramate dehydrogenase
MWLKYLKRNIDVTSLSNFKTKAIASYFFEINNRQDIDKLTEIVYFAKQNNLEILFVWAGTNMLFAFEKYNWIVIKNNLNWWNYNPETKILESYSNELISDIAESLEKDFWQDLWHRFIWLPWTIWWAVYGNAWCFWLETENNFLKAEILDTESGQYRQLSKKEMNFSYRSSILKEKWSRYFLIKAYFDLSKKVEKYHSDVDNIDFRENKQPKWFTCWSFFKNPSREFSAWYLIEQVWLKWYKIWWAYFSDLHANFLMSDWTATHKDLLNLIDLAQEKVKEEFWIDLINEVRIITN